MRHFIRTTLQLRKRTAQVVLLHVKRDAGIRAFVKNSVKQIVRQSVVDVVLDLKRETVVICFASVAVQVLHKDIVWPAETLTTRASARKSVHQC